MSFLPDRGGRTSWAKRAPGCWWRGAFGAAREHGRATELRGRQAGCRARGSGRGGRWGCDAVERAVFERKVGVQVDGVVRSCSWPSQRAIVDVSAPAFSSAIAAVWRSTCMETRFERSVGQPRWAVATCLARRRSVPSRVSGPPWREGNSGHRSGWSLDSRIQTRSTATLWRVSGATRSFRPLPIARTCGPVPRWTSAWVSASSSETRRPVCTAAAPGRGPVAQARRWG